MTTESKKTPLYDWHTAQGANMALFGGYTMPLWYPAGIKTEHLSVITHAGIFDTSHMAVVTITGSGAFSLLQKCFSKDLEACIGQKKAPLSSGRSVYGVFLNDKGEVIDDAVLSKIAENHYMVVVNAGMGNLISQLLMDNNEADDVVIIDLTDQLGKMDVQGPLSTKILNHVIKDADKIFNRFPYFSFKGHFDAGVPCEEPVLLNDGTPVLLSRTGYTGEFGFEIFVEKEHTVKLWELILDAGSSTGFIPCGLAARDSLRAGAGLPLSHQDVGPWLFCNNPWTFVLPYNKDQSGFSKKFTGDQALLLQEDAEFTYAFVGFDPRKIATEDADVYLNVDENESIGKILTCATDMAVGRHEEKIFSLASPNRPENFKPRGLSCGFIKVNTPLIEGQSLIIKDDRRKIKVVVTNDIRPDRTARRPIKEMLS
ncbi:MAG: aminomethyl transferase family protein [Desulfobacteraceae bacterium]|nr:aminomethyl transferase family protein [Desulfobacteraceae bacterium]MBC2755823.1 aminomethyl transferase family protein [Desulfobacteraceae bacterium]